MKRASGFTLIEILVAMLIFALSIFAVVKARTSSLKNTKESERIFQATQLAESKMTELEMKYKKDVDQGGLTGALGESNGTFDEAPGFTWKAELKESSLKFTQAAMMEFMKKLGVDEDTANQQADQMKIMLFNLNKALKDNFGEIHLTVQWQEGPKKYSLPLVTHILPAKPKIELSQTGEE